MSVINVSLKKVTKNKVLDSDTCTGENECIAVSKVNMLESAGKPEIKNNRKTRVFDSDTRVLKKEVDKGTVSGLNKLVGQPDLRNNKMDQLLDESNTLVLKKEVDKRTVSRSNKSLSQRDLRKNKKHQVFESQTHALKKDVDKGTVSVMNKWAGQCDLRNNKKDQVLELQTHVLNKEVDKEIVSIMKKLAGQCDLRKNNKDQMLESDMCVLKKEVDKEAVSRSDNSAGERDFRNNKKDQVFKSDTHVLEKEVDKETLSKMEKLVVQRDLEKKRQDQVHKSQLRVLKMELDKGILSRPSKSACQSDLKNNIKDQLLELHANADKFYVSPFDKENAPGSNTHLQMIIADIEVEAQIFSDPKSIALSILSKSRTLGVVTVKKDIFEMIEYCVHRGSDLQHLFNHMKGLGLENTLKRLIVSYNLVSKPTNDESITLSRVCASFPDITCQYVSDSPLIPFNSMEMQFINNYPKVMMDCSFAYLIPDGEEEFCALLKKAHMVYRYVLYHTVRSTLPNPVNVRKIISECIQHTRLAIEKKHTGPYLGKYSTQIEFLKAHDLIVEKDSKIVATKRVLQAATTWNMHIRTADMPTIYINDDSDYWFNNF